MIAIEGIDAVGKHTQSSLLSSWLDSRGLKNRLVDFPDYTTKIGMEIRAFLSGRRRYQPQVRHMLFAANRWEMAEKLDSILSSEETIIVNRYTESNLVYGVANGLDLDWLVGLESGLPKPNLVIVLDAPVVSIVPRRPGKRDRYESDLSLQRRVRTLYKRLGSRFGWVVVDASGTVEDVHKLVLEVVKSRVME